MFHQHKEAFRELLILDTWRGPHSTGVGVIDKGDNVKLLKAVGRPHKLLNTDAFDDEGVIKEFGIKALIGHNRFATMGAKTADNAHPFHHGKIVGAHNGTLERNYLYKLDDAHKFDVDSEAIFFNLNKNGFENTIGRLKGAWALVFYDADTRRMNFINNGERKLSYCFTKGGGSVFWASEGWMLEFVLDRMKIDRTEVMEFEPFKHYWIDLGANGDISKKNMVYKGDILYKGFTPPPVENLFYRGYQGTNVFNGDAREKAKTKEPIIELMNSFLGKEIEFYVFGEGKDALKVPYLYCSPVNHERDFDIRIYGNTTSPRWEELISSVGCYTAKVKKVIDRWNPIDCKQESYMLIDMRTLSGEFSIPLKEEPEAKPEKKEETKKDPDPLPESFADLMKENGKHPWSKTGSYKGFRGVKLVYEELVEVTKNGCCWCGENPEGVHKPSDLIFVGPKQFMCPDCNSHGEAQRFYGHLATA